MTAEASLAPIFLVGVRSAIQTMRDAGMNETQIACVITEIRSASIEEERLRLQLVAQNNQPKHIAWPDMKDAINAL